MGKAIDRVRKAKEAETVLRKLGMHFEANLVRDLRLSALALHDTAVRQAADLKALREALEGRE